MIGSNFQMALSLTVSHTYFEQDICTCLQFNHGPVTRALLKRFELKQNTSVNGFDLYINTNTPIPAFLTYVAGATGYTFF